MKRQSILVVVIVASLTSVSNAVLVEWPVGEGGNGHFYEAVLVLERISWSNAQTAAEQAGGYLATITSAEENEFVYNLISSPEFWYMEGSTSYMGPWLGGYQPPGSPEPDGNWQWVTDEPFVYTNWRTGQPDNQNGEDRLHYYSHHSIPASTWNDMDPATYGIRGYITEIPEPSTLLLLGLGAVMVRRKR